jgi:hypothetical protein
MLRQLGRGMDQFDIAQRHLRKRIEFESGAIELDDRDIGARRGLEALAAVDRCIERRHRARQRIDFADLAATSFGMYQRNSDGALKADLQCRCTMASTNTVASRSV